MVTKGQLIRDFIYIQKAPREILNAWIKEGRIQKGPIFPTRTGERLDRTQGFKILKRILRQANAHLPPDEHIEASPNVLRHTFLRKIAQKHGVQFAREASGQVSDCYIWRYVQPDRKSLAKAVDELE